MRIKNWRIYTTKGDFILNLKILLKSLMTITGIIMVIMTFITLIIVYSNYLYNILMKLF